MNYGNIKYYDIANGQGVRTTLFVSGCTNHCLDCFQPQTWDFNYGNLFGKSAMNEILEALDKEYIEGFSILGGEPFENENKETVYNVIRTVKEKFPQKTIWCYSGFCFEELAESSRNILELVDVLVDGAFVEEKKNLRLKFRGSENQRIIDVKKSLEKGETVEFEI